MALDVSLLVEGNVTYFVYLLDLPQEGDPIQLKFRNFWQFVH